MDKKQIEQIRKNMEAKSTDELLEIWVENDRKRYYDEVFEIVKQLLLERRKTIPPQGEEGRRFLMEEEKAKEGGSVKKLDKKKFEQIRSNMKSKSTEELIEIWEKNDRGRYVDETFEAVKQLLLERGETISSKGEEIIFLSESEEINDTKGRSNTIPHVAGIVGSLVIVSISLIVSNQPRGEGAALIAAKDAFITGAFGYMIGYGVGYLIETLLTKEEDIVGTASDFLPEEIKCPHCSAVLELEEEERKTGKITCPECNKIIDKKTISKGNS